MSDFVISELAKELTKDPAKHELRQATVVSVVSSGATSTIRLGGSTTDIAGVRSLIPCVPNDIVWVAKINDALLIVGHVDTGWHIVGDSDEPAYQNGWATYPGFLGARFRKVAGIVYLGGLIQGGSMWGGSWATARPFILPAGYRPDASTAQVIFPVVSNDAFGQVRILATGELAVFTGTNVWVSLWGISFPAKS